MKRRAAALALLLAVVSPVSSAIAEETAPESSPAESLQSRLAALEGKLEAARWIGSRFLLRGFASGGFEKSIGADSTFNLGLNPVLIWTVGDRLLVESELEIETMGDGIMLGLGYAQLTYVLNDYMTVGVGQFLNPSNVFAERFHPSWINKLPDAPLPFGHDGLAAMEQLGIQVRGGIPLGPAKLGYAVYLSNGPRLNVSEAGEAGNLSYENVRDNNQNKAIGGRVGFFPLPFLELGYGAEWSRPGGESVATGDFRQVSALIQTADLNMVSSPSWLRGTVDLRAQWLWSRVSDATYDPDGALGFGPLTFTNVRTGGYAQLAYRPTMVPNSVLSSLEAVVRYDMLDLPSGAPEAMDASRWTFGLDYWLGPSAVVKVAYELGGMSMEMGGTNPDSGGSSGGEAGSGSILVQGGIGF